MICASLGEFLRAKFEISLAIWYSFVESPSEMIAAKLSLPHSRGTNCTTALASELVASVLLLFEIKQKY